MKVVIQCSDGQYSFTRLGYLGDCEVAPEAVHEVDDQTVELWSAICRLYEVMQSQLKKLDVAPVDESEKSR
jgi:hypothetical protein